MIIKTIDYLRGEPLLFLLIFVPIAIIAAFAGWGELWVFILSALAVIPLAGLIGDSTEALASYTGPRVGGLLNATLGNAAELIITIVAIREGLLDLVKASITGSILGNLLLVMGMSFLLGGLRHGLQSFNRRQAGNNAILLVLAVIALAIPSLLSHSVGLDTSVKVEAFSLGVAVVMMVLYGLGILYGFKGHTGQVAAGSAAGHQPESGELAVTERTGGETAGGAGGPATKQAAKGGSRTAGGVPDNPMIVNPASGAADPVMVEKAHWSVRTALIVLGLATVGVAYLSELLVGAVEPIVASLGVSEFFIGIILIPIVGNVAEHLVAVKVAIQNHMELSVEIAVASSLQIALFVAPLLVFISLAMGNPLTLIFNQFELLALLVTVVISAFVSIDGESNWLEGAALIAVYLILALAFFLIPG